MTRGPNEHDFVPAKPLQPSLTYADKALALLSYIRLGWRVFSEAHTLTYWAP